MKKLTTKEVSERISLLTNNEYELVGKYINRRTKITVKHITCGNVYEVFSSDFFRKDQPNRCKKCSFKAMGLRKSKSNDKFLAEVYKLVKDEYTFLEPYVNNKHHLNVIHNKCNYKYRVKPNLFLQGYRCPNCNESRGERRIHEYLHAHKIKHCNEKKFKSCRDIRVLPFDFLIKIEDRYILIEFDGKQHFEDAFRCPKKFESLQRHDKIKTQWCITHNIPLIRISYKEIDEIEDILDSHVENVQRLSKAINSLMS